MDEKNMLIQLNIIRHITENIIGTDTELMFIDG
jgi:hypothetical protein